jgi:HTH-type transcriptional regulator/antitoxin HigA
MSTKYRPFVNIGPGDIIKRDLEALNWTQDDLSKIIGMSNKAVNEIVTNKTAVTIETAKLLSKAFGQSPQFWVNLDTNYRLRLKSENQKEKEAEIKAAIYKHMPVREMIKKGWINNYQTIDQLTDEAKKFWQMEEIDFSFMEEEELPNFRKSNAYFQYNNYYAMCWYQMAKSSAKNFDAPLYSKKSLEELATNLSGFTVIENGVEEFITKLNQTGVKFLVLSHLPKTYIDGASFYDNDNPVIVYTARYDRIDNFWFTIAHETAHILLHLEKGTYFVDDLESLDTPLEKESDFAASRMLKVRAITDYFSGKYRYISESQVRECGEQLNIAPAIIVGVLQYYKKLSRRNLNRFKHPVLGAIPGQYRVERKSIQLS